MAKYRIEEFDKELICPNCGWFGKLGDTVGPHQERKVEIWDKKKVEKVVNYHYCPDCYDSKTRPGTVVQWFKLWEKVYKI